MQLNEVLFDDATPIDGYGPGFFRIGGALRHGPILVLPDSVRDWGGYDDLETALAARDRLDVLFVGTGPEITHVPPGFRRPLEEAGLGVETMSSPQACRTFNVLLGEGRRVGAALLPVP
ncbi:hypothetical protein E2L08_12585 [Palleronia sediminis]|uniref:Mth938-like domain-containing protein n=1 Tax=Palleronia sediminis TaxID=2547833 RepID=A0A4V3B967_9RHOB|nr:Mth938-like domain-containing protein [Palleronia sediminis]TDL78129.1 hypothetical protein E2L08_12585 [Palleronia sediminis]